GDVVENGKVGIVPEGDILKREEPTVHDGPPQQKSAEESDGRFAPLRPCSLCAPERAPASCPPTPAPRCPWGRRRRGAVRVSASGCPRPADRHSGVQFRRTVASTHPRPSRRQLPAGGHANRPACRE